MLMNAFTLLEHVGRWTYYIQPQPRTSPASIASCKKLKPKNTTAGKADENQKKETLSEPSEPPQQNSSHNNRSITHRMESIIAIKSSSADVGPS